RADAYGGPFDTNAPNEAAHRLLHRRLRGGGAAGGRPDHDDLRGGSAGRALRALDLALRPARPSCRACPRRHGALVTELSADWVLLVDAPPIENGRVRFEGSRIVEVGPGRADRHFSDAAIVPGFVNAHSHLEYSVYAGF